MGVFAFEKITAAQAAAITGADILTIAGGPTNQITVIYNSDTPDFPAGSVSITVGQTSVTFGPGIAAVSLARNIRISDGSVLVIGDAQGNNLTVSDAGSPTNDALYGGGGNDEFRSGAGNDLMQGNLGNDTLIGGDGADVIYGGQDNDSVDAGSGLNFVQGNKGDDRIVGGGEADTLLGGQGNDTVEGGQGANFLNGNLGDDFLVGRDGDDLIFGEGGNDRIDAGYGKNVAEGGDGDDDIFAQGTDTLSGGDGNDTVTSYSANVSLVHGGAGNDVVRGGGLLFGDDGNDTVAAQWEGATVDGGAGDDLLRGSGAGGYIRSETLLGGEGNDTLLGIDGLDVLSGGAGADVFQYYAYLDANSAAVSVGGLERVVDWSREDHFQFAVQAQPDGSHRAVAGTSDNYAERTAADYATARSVAESEMQGGRIYVAVQIGGDVVLFADTSGFKLPSDAVALIGRTLNDIDFSNIIGGDVR